MKTLRATVHRFITIPLAVAGAAAGIACGNNPGAAQPGGLGASSQQTRVPGEYIVTLSAGASADAITALYGRYGIRSMQTLAPNLVRVTVTEDPGPAAMEKLRAQNAAIQAVQPNFVYRMQKSQ